MEWSGKIESKHAEGKLKEMLDNLIDFSKYDSFLAECYEAEDEFWDKYFEDIEADEVILFQKENF